MKAVQLFRLTGAMLLLVLTSSVKKTDSYNGSTESTAAATHQAEKKTVIQDLCWSPDGRYIYFSAMKVKPDFSDFTPELWTVYRFDTSAKSTSVIVKSAVFVAAAPNGEIAVSKNTGKTRHIYLLDKNGKNPTPLVAAGTKTFGPTWSPDGSRLAFSVTEGGQTEIYAANRDGGDLKRLTHSQGHSAYNPAWSPDGQHIAYYLEKGDGVDQIHVMKADGTEDRNVTNDRFNNIFPGWIHNNTVIYGQAHKEPPTKTFQVHIDGTDKKQVLQLESFYARFSPDKKKIAYIDERERDINVITATGDMLYQITVPDSEKAKE